MPSTNAPHPDQAAQILKTVFGYDSFRPLQRDVIDTVLSRRDTLAVMPTGGGKSICYQVPALIFPGLTIVLSPLIALMHDQVASLEQAGVRAAVLNSSLSREEWAQNARLVASSEAKLLYLAPESLATDRVRELLAGARVDCVTVDEAHCISDWGHDFRPEYRALASAREAFPDAVFLALTATASARVRADIKKNLALSSPAEFIASFDRPNIYLEVRPKKNPVHQILAFLAERPRDSGIVYCFSRKQVDDVASELSSRGYAALPYHAGLADETRAANQERFLSDEAKIMVATIAFGMGINKPNVRFVIHFDLPKSLEQYYQEIGRAGRDGEDSTALLLYSYGDTKKIQFFMEELSARDSRAAETHLAAMTDYAQSRTCRRAALLKWFGEAYTPRGEAYTASDASSYACCDVCDRAPAPDADVTVPAQKLLSCVARTGERYGAAYVIDVLLGSRQKRIVDNGHHRLSTWGIGKDVSKDDWFELSRLLVEAGYLAKSSDYGVLSLTRDARDALTDRSPILLPFAGDLTGTLTGSLTNALGNSPSTGADDSVPGTGNALARKQARLKKPVSSDADPALLSALRTLRRSLAEEASVPPFVVFSDKTLEELAVKRPATRDELLSVKGIGEVKADRYGEFIMRAIRGKE